MFISSIPRLSNPPVTPPFSGEHIVLAVPMHNFGPPSTLKAWIDHVVRIGRTVSYSQKGPEGMLKGKRAILVLARGGVYSDGPAKPMDFQEPYLRTVLGFIGITDINVVPVEGLAMSAIGPEKAVGSAMARSREILSQVAQNRSHFMKITATIARIILGCVFVSHQTRTRTRSRATCRRSTL